MNGALAILLAEDNEDDAFLLKQALTKTGVKSSLHVVRHGKEAQAYIKGEGAFADRRKHPAPDVFLLDLNMPQMSGFEVLQWLRKESSQPRLVTHVLSASVRDSDVERAYELGANSYLLKPSRIDELTAMLEALHHWHKFTQFPKKTTRHLNAPAMAHAL